MSFLLNTIGDGAPMLITLLVCAVFAIGFYIYKTKTAKKTDGETNDSAESASVDTADESGDEEEIIAVIAAAIAMAESESEGLKFKVVSFRRI